MLFRSSHMLKSNEWGSVAYLSHSNYGKNEEIRFNNCNRNITGCGASSANSTQTSNCEIPYAANKDSYPQSTTGNISGVFDMSGGASERVMGNFGKNTSASEFNENLDNLDMKFYNLFNTTIMETACDGVCLGQALSETKGWYSDSSYFLSNFYPWLRRGGSYGDNSEAGIFSSDSDGGSYTQDSFRIAILP